MGQSTLDRLAIFKNSDVAGAHGLQQQGLSDVAGRVTDV
jgi:hypothetical protein